MKSWDEYEIKARYIPTLLSVIPLTHFLILFVGESFWQELLNNIAPMNVIANVSLSLLVMLAFVQFQTSLSKIWIEESIFGKGGDNFPTTKMLVYCDGLISKERKEQIRSKISKISECRFSTEKEEREHQEIARLQAREAVGHIRSVVGHGVNTIQYNIRYGFFRNIIGGVGWSTTGSLGCSILYYLDNNWQAMSFFIAYFCVFVALYVFRKGILEKLAFNYADNLFNEFLNFSKGAN